MRKMRGYIPTVALLVTMVLGSTAQAGIIVGDRGGATGDTNPCEEKTTTDVVIDFVTGIATLASGGIIVGDFTDSNETCGIIVGDRNGDAAKTGIIVGD